MNDKQAQILSPRDLDLIRNYLVGGAAMGGGVALGTSLANHIKTLKSEGADSSKDDDTIYLNVPAVKQAVLGGGAAVAGGVLATLGSYALVRKAYQAVKRKRLQEELDEAQNAYVGSIQTEGVKQSSEGKPMGAVELLTSFPIALPILLGLGSGALANKFLDESFPGRRKRLTTTPKRIVLRSQNPEAPVDEEEALKNASEAGTEFLMHLALAKKEASSDLKDMVAAVAQGRCSEMENALMSTDTNTMFDLIKGASETPVSKPYALIASAYLAKSAMLSPIVRQLAAAEFSDMSPVMFKLAQDMDEETADALAGITSTVSLALRGDELMEWVRTPDMSKYASAVEGGANEELLLRRFLDKASDTPESNMADQDTESSSDKKPRVLAADAAAQRFKNENLDIIDQVLGGDTDGKGQVPQPLDVR